MHAALESMKLVAGQRVCPRVLLASQVSDLELEAVPCGPRGGELEEML